MKYNGKYFSYKVSIVVLYCNHIQISNALAHWSILFTSQPKHDLKDKTQLLELITKCPEGLLVVDVKDSYTSVLDDLKVNKNYYIILLLFVSRSSKKKKIDWVSEWVSSSYFCV